MSSRERGEENLQRDNIYKNKCFLERPGDWASWQETHTTAAPDRELTQTADKQIRTAIYGWGGISLSKGGC